MRGVDRGTLVVRLDGTVVQTVLLGDSVVTVGRGPGNDVVLPHQSVSRSHAEVRAEAAGVTVVDVESRGGTSVDGVRLLPNQPAPLDAASSVRVGPYEITYTPPRPDPVAFRPPNAALISAPPAAPDPGPAAAEWSAHLASAPGLSDDGEPDGPTTPAPGRPTFPVPLPEGPASRYLRDLPAIFQDEDPGGPGGGGTLVVTRDGTVLRTLALGERVITVGRLPGNDVVLPDASVSDRHAEVRAEAAEVKVVDVGSAGGTSVDGVPLPRDTPAALDTRAVVRVGPYELTYKRPRPNDFLGRMLLIFEALWEPLEQRQDHIALYYDPRTAPAEMLPWIASWLDLALDHHWPEARRRRLVREAMDLYRWRGTPYGLARMLEVSAGVTARVTDDPAEPWVVRVAVTLPPTGEVRREAVEALVRAHKPAHVGYVLEFLP